MFVVVKITLFFFLSNSNFILTYGAPLNENYSLLNPHEDWCPNVSCNTGVTCEPCKRRFLFILAQGRSGSTTLKNMVNLLPGVRLSGETGSLIESMQQLYHGIRNERSFERGAEDFRNSWGHNAYDPYYLSCPAQNMLEALNPPSSIDDDDSSTIIGIKEIKIRTDATMKFLIDHFPCSRFIFNVRSDEKGSLSAANNFGSLDNLRSSIPRLFQKYHKILGTHRSYMMDMVKWSTGTNHFNDLATWLGFEKCVYSGLLHDHFSGYHLDNNVINVGDECRYAKADTSIVTNKKEK